VEFEGVFMGTLRESTIGKLEMKEERLGLSLKLPFGSVKKRPADYFEGSIMQHGKPVVSCRGTYLGFVSFDGKRYWDGRKVKPFRLKFIHNSRNSKQPCLPSDSCYREDLKLLAQGSIKHAQLSK